MARFQGGWFTAQRSLAFPDKKNPFYGKPHLLALHYVLMSWAALQDTVADDGTPVKRGEVLTSYRELGDFCGMTIMQTRTAISNMADNRVINRLGNRGGLHLSICNYEQTCCAKKNSNRADNRGPNRADNTIWKKEETKEETKRKEEFNPPEGGPSAANPAIPANPRKGRPTTEGGQVWEAYRAAYAAKYATEPVRNGKTNSLCCQLVLRLGVEQAVKVAAFYVGHNDRFYVQKVHMLDFCIKDAEKLNTESQNNVQMTSTMAGQIDLQQSNRSAIEAHLRAKYGTLRSI